MKVAMLNINILSALLVVIFFRSSQGNNYLNIQSISRFPIQISVPFEITISPKDKSKLSNFELDTMVIQITDENQSDKEMAVFEFGMKEVSDQDFNGEYFRIPIWGKNEEKRIIFSVINFTRLAHRKFLEIYILNPTSTNELKKMLNNLKLANLIYKSQIFLLIPSEIELKVNSKTGKEVGVVLGSIVEATCRAFNGLPKTKPDFKFQFISHFTNLDLNILQIKFRVSMAEHGKNLTCQAGNEIKNVTINVFHRPTNVALQPEVNETVGNNTNIICAVSDGYPIPRIEWTFIEGPPNSTAYYQIDPNTQRLFIKENAPIGSKWRFRCTAKNFILEKPGTFDRPIYFEIINQKRNLTENKHSFSYNTTSFDKRTDRKNLSQIAELNKKLNDLELSMYSSDLKISSLKDSSYSQRLQIFQLKQSVSKLNDKQLETIEEIIKIKKIVNTEIKNLKNEIEKLNTNLLKKNEKNPFDQPKSINKIPLRMPIATFDWNIYKVSYLRRKRKIIRGSKFRNGNIRFAMMLFLQFDDIEYLRITVHMSPIHDADSSLLIKGYVNITLMNYLNLAHQKSMKLYFQRGRKSANVKFNFKYIDLYQNQILQSDDIIIRCSLIIL